MRKKFFVFLNIAFRQAWDGLVAGGPESIRHINESVFRYEVIKKLLLLRPDYHLEDEWNRIDLLLRRDDEQAAVEFKFYDARPFNPINGQPRLKGGAGRKNFSEFISSLKTLKFGIDQMGWYKSEGANITERIFILVGTKRLTLGAKGDFKEWYYPAERINPQLDGFSLVKIAEHSHRMGDLEVFGWLCILE